MSDSDETTIRVHIPGHAPIETTAEKLKDAAAKVGIGHNSDGSVSSERLRSFVKRIEKLEEDKASIGEDLKEVYAEAKGTGFDTKIIRKIVALRKIELEKRREEAELLELYKSALGMEE